MDIYQFEQFRAIAECGTMREAADMLYLSQPTLSYNLKKMESELGCQLFTRRHNQLRISPYGEIVLRYSQELSGRMQSMLDEIEDRKRQEAATLHIGCFSPIVSSFLLPQVAAELPDSSFEVVNSGTADLVAGLNDGRFDILIATDICRDKSFRWHKIYSEQAFVSAPQNSTFLGFDKATGDHLKKIHFNIEEGLLGYSDWFAYILRNANVDDSSIEFVHYKEHLKTKDTLSTCNLITSFIMNFVRVNESRVIVPIDEEYAQRNIGLLYRVDAPEKVIAFVNHVLENASKLFSGNTFIPFFLYPESAGNLRILNE